MLAHYDLLPLLRHMSRRLDEGHSLESLAARAGLPRFQLHRAFARIVGETPKQYLLRLRLELAAAKLAAGRRSSVLKIAIAAGFGSHEVFTRAFRRHFDCTPARYRATALVARVNARLRARHLELTRSIGPCIRLYRFPIHEPPRRRPMPTLSIERKEIAAQPILYIRRKVSRAEIAATLGECFGKLFGHGQQAGLPIAGWPLARYVEMTPGSLTIDSAMPLATAVAGEGEMQAGLLPAGPVAVAVHAGPYEQLPETFMAVERWIEANGYRAAPGPWESYVTDPGEHPDPADWRTEVYVPLAS